MRFKQSLLAAMLSTLILPWPLAAQEADAPDEDSPAVETVGETEPSADAGVDDEALVEDGLDEQSFEEDDDDDFVPTEEIGADQSIPFPTDI